jgi:hypothetical protein
MRFYRRLVTVAAGVLAVTGAVATSANAATTPTPMSASQFTVSTTYSAKSDIVSALATKLGTAPLHTVMDNANHDRTGTESSIKGLPGYSTGFRFDGPDNSDCNNVPQGITSSRDAVGDGAANGRYDGRQIMMVSWYTRTGTPCDSGAAKTTRNRLTFVDWDANHPNSYRKVLLVSPTGSATAPNFTDVTTHAGGIVWSGNYVYVADTSHGMRIYDMRKIVKVNTGGSASDIGCSGGVCHAHNYAYVMPQVGTVTANTTSGTPLAWSTISLDRVSHSIVMAEYTCSSGCTAYPNRASRAVRFPFSSSGIFAANTTASQAVQLPWYKINGVASHNGRWWFNSSGAHQLYYWTPSAGSHTYPWVSGGESISYWEDDTQADLLWSLQETQSHRNVFAVKQASYGG